MREIYDDDDDALDVSKGEPHFKMIANENPNEIRRFWIWKLRTAFGNACPTLIEIHILVGSLHEFFVRIKCWFWSSRAFARIFLWNNVKSIFATWRRFVTMDRSLTRSWIWWVLIPKSAINTRASWISQSRPSCLWSRFVMHFPGRGKHVCILGES